MNLLISDPNLCVSAQYLDNKRLVKQILECRQILKVYQRLANGEEKVGYKHHPITKFYQNNKQLVIDFAVACCDEYTHRYGKTHKYNNELRPLRSDDLYVIDVRPEDVLYIEGDINISDDTTFIRMQEKLINKWISSKQTVMWNKRDVPYFLRNYFNRIKK